MDLVRHNSFLLGNYAPPALEIAGGSGSWLWDSSGRKFLDFTSGIAVASLGHCHPHWVKQVGEQSKKLIHCSNLFSIPEQVRLAERLVSKIGPGKVLFCNSGAEANEAMLKLSRLFGNQSPDSRRHKILVAKNGFHGRTMGALSATESIKYRDGFEPLLSGFVFCEFNDPDDFEEAADENTVAVLVESIQGEGGMHVATTEFLVGLQNMCARRNLLFLLDEVQAGIGRTGEFLGYQHAGVRPDAVALAKGIGGGFPLGAVWICDERASLFAPGSHGTTYGGSPLACSAAHAVLDVLERENLTIRAKDLGERFFSNLEALQAEYPSLILEVRGKGLMLGLALSCEPAAVIPSLRDLGLLTVGAAGRTLRLLPPLTVEEEELEQALKILHDGFAGIDH